MGGASTGLVLRRGDLSSKARTHASNKWIVTRLYAGHAANISRYMADVNAADPESRLYALAEMLKCENPAPRP